jgi:hypothetical protein
MDPILTARQLQKNMESFLALLNDADAETVHWKPGPAQWCLLEVVCHLYDEEREDFRASAAHLLKHPGTPPPLFDQLAWVTERKYMEQDYEERLKAFVDERRKSIRWILSERSAKWHHAFQHEKRGAIAAGYYLTNWVAHDLLHLRQIIKIKYLYWKQTSDVDLDYAGAWVTGTA